MLRVLPGALLVLISIGAGCSANGGDPLSEDAREVAVYAAVIRDVAESLPTGDEDPSERIVFVEPLDPDSAIGLEVQAGVVLELEDVATVSFIDDREAALDHDEEGAPVRKGAALIALGPLPESRRRVVVDVERYAHERDVEHLRYVVERVGEGWGVTERRSVG